MLFPAVPAIEHRQSGPATPMEGRTRNTQIIQRTNLKRETFALFPPPVLIQVGPVQPYPSFAVIVILAFSTFDTGHPFSAASAYF